MATWKEINSRENKNSNKKEVDTNVSTSYNVKSWSELNGAVPSKTTNNTSTSSVSTVPKQTITYDQPVTSTNNSNNILKNAATSLVSSLTSSVPGSSLVSGALSTAGMVLDAYNGKLKAEEAQKQAEEEAKYRTIQTNRPSITSYSIATSGERENNVGQTTKGSSRITPGLSDDEIVNSLKRIERNREFNEEQDKPGFVQATLDAAANGYLNRLGSNINAVISPLKDLSNNVLGTNFDVRNQLINTDLFDSEYANKWAGDNYAKQLYTNYIGGSAGLLSDILLSEGVGGVTGINPESVMKFNIGASQVNEKAIENMDAGNDYFTSYLKNIPSGVIQAKLEGIFPERQFLTNTNKRTIKQLVSSFVGEGSEEAIQNIADRIYDKIANQDLESSKMSLYEIIMESLNEFIVGGAIGATGGALHGVTFKDVEKGYRDDLSNRINQNISTTNNSQLANTVNNSLLNSASNVSNLINGTNETNTINYLNNVNRINQANEKTSLSQRQSEIENDSTLDPIEKVKKINSLLNSEADMLSDSRISPENRLYENGEKVFIEDYGVGNNTKSISNYESAFNAYYKAGKVGIPYMTVKQNTDYANYYLSDKTLERAYQAGVEDGRNAYDDYTNNTKVNEQGYGVVTSDVSRRYKAKNPEMFERMEIVAKNINAKVQFLSTGDYIRQSKYSDLNFTEEGNVNLPNGFYKDGVVYILETDVNPVGTTLFHEFTHRLEKTSNGYDAYATFVLDFMKNNSKYNDLYKKYEKVYNTQKDSTIKSELIADFTGRLSQDEAFVKSLVKEHRGFAEKIRDFYRTAIKVLTGKNENIKIQGIELDISVKDIKQAEKLLTKAINEADAINKNAENETKYSKENIDNSKEMLYNGKNISDDLIPYIVADKRKVKYLPYCNIKEFYELDLDIMDKISSSIASRATGLELGNIDYVFYENFIYKFEVYNNDLNYKIISIIDSSSIIEEVKNESSKRNLWNVSRTNMGSNSNERGGHNGDFITNTNNGTSKQFQGIFEKNGHFKNDKTTTLYESKRNVKGNKFSLDSEGNTLSQEQIEFFKDSKVRDDKGNLLVVYHGSETTFNIFDSNKKSKYGNNNVSFYTTNKEVSKSYGKVQYEGYANAINPYVLDGDTNGTTLEYSKTGKDELVNNKEIIKSIREKLDKNGSAYWKKSVSNISKNILENKKQILSNVEINYLVEHPFSLAYLSVKAKDGFIPYSKSIMTNDIINAVLSINEKIDNKYDSVVFKSIEDAGKNYNNDSFIKNDVIALFDSNQFKNVDNTNPTESNNIRYSLEENNSEIESFESYKNWVINNFKKRDVRRSITKVRGGWTLDKIQKELKSKFSFNNSNGTILSYTPEQLLENLYYHGSNNINNKLKAGSVVNENERNGGYGQDYHSISLSKSRKRASVFAGPITGRGYVTPVVLLPNANIIEMQDINDSIELEDMLPELWNKGVDGVKIGNWNDEYSEQELVILNPHAISTITYSPFVDRVVQNDRTTRNKDNFTLEDVKELQKYAENKIKENYKEKLESKNNKEKTTLDNSNDYDISYSLNDSEGNTVTPEYVNKLYQESNKLEEELNKLRRERDSIKQTTEYINNNVGADKVRELNQKIYPLENKARKAYYDYAEANDTLLINEQNKKIAESGLSRQEYFIKEAIKEFGTTFRLNLAGYILPDGKLLNFGGDGRVGRYMDHRSVSNLFAGAKLSGSNAMYEFMSLGNIRISKDSNFINLISDYEPTAEQYSQIRKLLIDADEFTVDFTDAKNGTNDYAEYSNVNPDKIINDIKNYYKTGKLPQKNIIDDFLYSRDSEGNTLTKEQIEYFKNSVERTPDGLLRIMYHGGGTAINIYDSNKANPNAAHGSGFYFTTDKSHASQYGSVQKFYLDIRHPLDFRSIEVIEKIKNGTYKKEISKEQLRKLITAMFDNDNFSMENYGQGKTIDYLTNEIYKKDSDYSMIMDLNTTAVGNAVELVKFVNETLGTDFDAITTDYEHVVFNSNQIKLTTNTKPTESDDIRYSLDENDPLKQISEVEKTPTTNIISQLQAEIEDLREENIRQYYDNVDWAKKMISWNLCVQRDEYNQRLKDVKDSYKEKIANNEKEFKERIKKEKEEISRIKKTNEVAKRWTDAETKEKIKEIKEQEAKRLKETISNQKEKTKAKRTVKELKESITKGSKELSSMLLNPTDKKHIPENFRNELSEFLSYLDFSTDRQGDKKVLDLMKLHYTYLDIQSKSPNADLFTFTDGEVSNYNLFDENVSEMMRELNGKRIADMDVFELSYIDTIIKSITTRIKNANKIFLEGRALEISEVVSESLKGLKQNADYMGGPANPYFAGMNNMLRMQMLRPVDFFETIGLSNIYSGLRKSYDDYIDKITIAKDFIENNILNDKELLKQINDEKLYDFKLENGQTISLTKGQLLTLYNTNKREQARGHIYGFGIKPADAVVKSKEIDKQGNPSWKVGLKRTVHYSPTQVTIQDVNNIINSLSEKERQFADNIMKFFDTYAKDWINETTVRLYGYEKATAENYFPIYTDSNFLDTNFDVFKIDPTINNWGSLKATTVGAKNAIIIKDILDIFTEHVSKSAMFSSFAESVDATKRVINYKSVQDGSIKDIMDTKFGHIAFDYLKNFMFDVQAGMRTEKSPAMVTELMKMYKASVIGANLRSVIQQPTAITKTLAYLDPKYLTTGIFKKSDAEEMYKYSRIARYKHWGFSNMDIGRDLKSIMLNERALTDWAFEGLQVADDVTWGKIWNACKLEIAEKNPELLNNKEDYLKAVADRFDYIIDKTQVVDSVFHKADVLRQKDGMWKVGTAFMSEPTSNYSMFISALYDYKKTKSKESLKQLRRSTFSMVLTGFNTALACTLYDMLWRNLKLVDDDDDDEGFLNKLWKNYMDQFGSMIPFLKDVISYFEGYKVERMEYQGIARFVTANQKLIDYCKAVFSNEDSMTANTLPVLIKNEIASFCDMCGIPVNDTLREIDSAINVGLTATENYSLFYSYNTLQYNPEYSTNKSKFIDILWGAYKNYQKTGDSSDFYFIKNDLEERYGYSEKYIQDSLKNRQIKDIQNDKDLQKAYKEYLNTNDSTKITKEINDLIESGKNVKVINKALEGLRKEENKSDVNMDIKYPTPEKAAKAYAKGDVDLANQIANALIEKDYTRDEIINEVNKYLEKYRK